MKRAAEACHFDLVLAHAYKRAALTDAFIANEKELVNVSGRVLKDIGDHAKNYHENYVRLGDSYLSDLMVEVKIAYLNDFVEGLNSEDKSLVLNAFSGVLVRKAKN